MLYHVKNMFQAITKKTIILVLVACFGEKSDFFIVLWTCTQQPLKLQPSACTVDSNIMYTVLHQSVLTFALCRSSGPPI